MSGPPDVITGGSSALDEARAAAAAYRWPRAFELFKAAAQEGQLDATDLSQLGEAAWWVGQLGEAISARERAYAAHVAAGSIRQAAAAALAVANDYSHRLEAALASGWVGRAKRLLADVPESREHALLERALLNAAMAKGDFDAALEGADRVMAIGGRLNDADIQGLGLHDRGRVLVAAGRVDEGMELLEEAVVAAVNGELSPYPTAVVYCNATVVCEDVADYRRAGEFAEAAKRWCERQEISGFPGMCRVRRAEITRLRGDWDAAEQEARTACAELREFCFDYAGEGYYQIGEIRMRLGDPEGAEESFTLAHRFGRSPQPGLALLRLAQDMIAAAESMINEALADPAITPLTRAKLLPAGVEIALAAHHQVEAESAAMEMENIAATYGTEALQAAAADARGLVALAVGSTELATGALRRAVRLWQSLGAPYEVARSQMGIAMALARGGFSDGARLEASAARQVFERLKAAPDAERAARLLALLDREVDHGRATERVTRTLMFTDIVGSTDLVEAIGDDAWESLRSWHDATIRSLVGEHGGEEVDHAGDGFFIAFADAHQAIDCALAIRDRLRSHRRQHGFAPSVRIGLHTAPAARTASGYTGAAVHTAARIGALAGADEIVVSEATLEASGRDQPHQPPRDERLKGVREPVRVATLT